MSFSEKKFKEEIQREVDSTNGWLDSSNLEKAARWGYAEAEKEFEQELLKEGKRWLEKEGDAYNLGHRKAVQEFLALLAEQRKELDNKIHKNGRSSGCLRDAEELLVFLEERLK